jgi:hypothetical protein
MGENPTAKHLGFDGDQQGAGGAHVAPEYGQSRDYDVSACEVPIGRSWSTLAVATEAEGIAVERRGFRRSKGILFYDGILVMIRQNPRPV